MTPAARHRWRTVLAAGAAALAGCASPLPHMPPPPDPPGSFVTLTKPIIALGDTQEHQAAGFPLHDNSGAVDAYVEVAQRPPEQPLFGRRILEWAMQAHPGEPVIHLGDLLDLSCQSELARMNQVFHAARQPGALLPGNHDGLMFGIYNYDAFRAALDPDASHWDHGCRRPDREDPGDWSADPRGAAVTKREFIEAYLRSLAAYPRLQTLAPLPSGPDVRLSWRSPYPDTFIAAIEARLLEGQEFARSFIAQNLRLPAADGAPRRVRIIALDTNQVSVLVGTLDTLRGVSPGSIGHVYPEQVDAIAPWVEEARRAGDIVVFAGHHNWARISWGSQARLADLMRRVDHPLVYISAHTHRGFWALHALLDRKLLELNVSSLSDWPIAYRRVTFAYDPVANRIKVVGELMPKLESATADDRDLLRGWVQGVCARSGIPVERIQVEDLGIVMAQRESRGTLMDWIYQGLGEWCESCRKDLYEQAHRYADAMLEVILQMHNDFGDDVWRHIGMTSRPAGCERLTIPACIANLNGERPDTLQASIDLYRRKAQLIDELQQQLDRLESPRAKAYMTCRAVVAAKIDFDLTPDDRNADRGEAKRRADDFFRIEATVGTR